MRRSSPRDLATASTTAATLTVDSVTVSTDPISQTVTAGNSVTFTASATGNPAPTVQWDVSSNGGSSFTAISGATSTSYSFSAAAGENGVEYEAIFTAGLAIATTTAATLTVDFVPTVTTNPSSQTVAVGSSVTFTASASANPAATVQWELEHQRRQYVHQHFRCDFDQLLVHHERRRERRRVQGGL